MCSRVCGYKCVSLLFLSLCICVYGGVVKKIISNISLHFNGTRNVRFACVIEPIFYDIIFILVSVKSVFTL